MNRLLRKYNRILLAVFGVGLMIVFLMPQLPELLQRFGGTGSLIATMGEDGRKVTRQDWQIVQQQMQVLQRLEQFQQPLPVIGAIGNDVERYYLLVHEAAEAGMIGGAASAGLDLDAVLRLSQQIGMPPAVVRQTLSNLSGIQRDLSMVASSGRLSDRRLMHDSRKMLDSVRTRVVVVPAEASEATNDPTTAEQQAHFDAWAEVVPGEGEHGFGYRLPDRASLEWIEIPRDAVEQSVRDAIARNDIEARMYWRKNAARFSEVEPGAAVPDDVINAYVTSRVDELMPTIARTASDTLRGPRRGFDTESNFLVLPDDWSSNQIALADLRQSLAEEFDLATEGDRALPLPETSEELLNMEAIAALPRIGRSGTERFGPTANGARQRRLSDMVQASRELGGQGEVPVQVGVAMPVLEDLSGNLWIVRMTEADPSRPPHDLEEVQTEVVENLRRQSRWNDMQPMKGHLQDLASSGIEAVAVETKAPVRGPLAMQRNLAPGIAKPPTIPGLGSDQEIVDQIVMRSIELGHEPLESIDMSERIMVIPSDRHMALVVAELGQRDPLQQEQYDRYVELGTLPSLIVAEDFGGPTLEPLKAAFSTEALRDRHNFRFSGSDDAEATNSPAPATTN